MKTERKEELDQNELSDWLTTLLEDLKPYAKIITAAAVLLVLGILLFSFGSAQRQKNQALAWTDLFALQVNANSAIDPDSQADFIQQLIDLGERESGSDVGAWAMQYAGDMSLALGSQKLWEDRDAAAENFSAAVSSYDSALAQAKHDLLKQRAIMGLAQANEAMNKFDAAQVNYEDIIQSWPETPMAKSAGDRLAFLQKNSTRQFYDWFMKQEPPQPQQPPAMTSPFSSVSPPNSSDVPNPKDVLGIGLDDAAAAEDATSNLEIPAATDGSDGDTSLEE